MSILHTLCYTNRDYCGEYVLEIGADGRMNLSHLSGSDCILPHFLPSPRTGTKFWLTHIYYGFLFCF